MRTAHAPFEDEAALVRERLPEQDQRAQCKEQCSKHRAAGLRAHRVTPLHTTSLLILQIGASTVTMVVRCATPRGIVSCAGTRRMLRDDEHGLCAMSSTTVRCESMVVTSDGSPRRSAGKH